MNTEQFIPAASAGRVSDRVADMILARIASGEWGPGSRLPGERNLAEEFGVSRVSVRAALQGLKTRGLVAAVQGGGTRVISSSGTIQTALAELVRESAENLRDLVEIRACLEAWAVRRAAENASDDDIAELAAIIAASEADRWAGKQKTALDLRFHLAVAKAAGSAVFLHIVGVIRGILREMVEYHRYELAPTAEDDEAALTHHRHIFEAIRVHDPEAAAVAMERHLGWVTAKYAGQPAARQSPPGEVAHP
jgi:DNA-binding FadR family transcriptional regulator